MCGRKEVPPPRARVRDRERGEKSAQVLKTEHDRLQGDKTDAVARGRYLGPESPLQPRSKTTTSSKQEERKRLPNERHQHTSPVAKTAGNIGSGNM